MGGRLPAPDGKNQFCYRLPDKRLVSDDTVGKK